MNIKTTKLRIKFIGIVVCLLLVGCSGEDYMISWGNRDARDGDYEKALKRYAVAIEKNPRSEIAYYNSGLAWSSLDKTDNAIEAFTKVIELNNKHIDAYFERGFIYLKKGDDDLAIDDFTIALQLNPNNSLKAIIYFNRAAALYGKSDYNKSIEDYSKGLQIDVDNFEAFNTRADAWYELGNLKNAIKDYSNAIKIKPGYSKAIFNRAMTYQEIRDFKSASADYGKSIALDPQNAQIYNNYSWLLSTCTDSKFLDGAKAIQLAQKAIEINPNEPFYYSTLAAAYAESGNFKEAVNTVQKAILMLESHNQKELTNILLPKLEAYKSGKPWREDVKQEDWMSDYLVKEK